MKTKYFLIFSLCLLFMAWPLLGQAAKLKMVGISPIGVDGDILVNLVAEVDKPVNAIEGKISWPTDLLAVKDIRIANSIVNFWLTEPQAKNGVINFSGIIPGGFRGEGGPVLSVVFHSLKLGSGVITVTEPKLLLNNGEGTPLVLTVEPLPVDVVASVAPKLIPRQFNDRELPETFRPVVGRDLNLENGKYFLAFSTVDKNSGVSRYQVKESKYRLFSYFVAWQTATSPYILLDQSLGSYIYVKASDRAGNDRIVRINPQLTIKWYESIWFWGIIILVILFLVATRIKNDQID